MILYLLVAGTAGPVTAADDSGVARWVDDQGVTHFGNPQFAPKDHTLLDVAPANGMVPAEYSRGKTGGTGPKIMRLERSKMQNKRGFRGFQQRPAARSGQSRGRY